MAERCAITVSVRDNLSDHRFVSAVRRCHRL